MSDATIRRVEQGDLPILLDTAAGYQFTFPFGITPFASPDVPEV